MQTEKRTLKMIRHGLSNFALLLIAFALPVPTLAVTPPAVQRAVKTVINGPQRTPAYAQRDRYRSEAFRKCDNMMLKLVKLSD